MTAPSARIATLDILRGVAVMGILAMNAAAFSMPEPAYFNPAAYGGADGIDLFAWTASFILVDGKMRGLFSLLFGASLLLIADAAEAKGESAARVHYARMVWLALFGAAHLYLLWWGDILLHYALVGLAAFLFRNLGLKQLGLWIVILLTIDLFLVGSLSQLFLATSAAALLPGADPAVVASWASMRSEFAPLAPDTLAADLALHRGPYWPLAAERLDRHGTTPLFALFLGGAETLAYMLIGMAGLRSGFLTGAWAPRRYRRIAAVCLAVGAAGFAALAWLVIRSGFDPATIFAASFGGAMPFRLLMSLGYAALIILLARRGGALVGRIAAAGRAAFSNYLGTSLLMTSLFYGYGLGLYGTLSRAEVYGVILGVWVLILLWSKPWLDRYRYGPFEWLWRSLARGKLQRMRRPSPEL